MWGIMPWRRQASMVEFSTTLRAALLKGDSFLVRFTAVPGRLLLSLPPTFDGRESSVLEAKRSRRGLTHPSPIPLGGRFRKKGPAAKMRTIFTVCGAAIFALVARRPSTGYPAASGPSLLTARDTFFGLGSRFHIYSPLLIIPANQLRTALRHLWSTSRPWNLSALLLGDFSGVICATRLHWLSPQSARRARRRVGSMESQRLLAAADFFRSKKPSFEGRDKVPCIS